MIQIVYILSTIFPSLLLVQLRLPQVTLPESSLLMGMEQSSIEVLETVSNIVFVLSGMVVAIWLFKPTDPSTNRNSFIQILKIGIVLGLLGCITNILGLFIITTTIQTIGYTICMASNFYFIPFLPLAMQNPITNLLSFIAPNFISTFMLTLFRGMLINDNGYGYEQGYGYGYGQIAEMYGMVNVMLYVLIWLFGIILIYIVQSQQPQIQKYNKQQTVLSQSLIQPLKLSIPSQWLYHLPILCLWSTIMGISYFLTSHPVLRMFTPDADEDGDGYADGAGGVTGEQHWSMMAAVDVVAAIACTLWAIATTVQHALTSYLSNINIYGNMSIIHYIHNIGYTSIIILVLLSPSAPTIMPILILACKLLLNNFTIFILDPQQINKQRPLSLLFMGYCLLYISKLVQLVCFLLLHAFQYIFPDTSIPRFLAYIACFVLWIIIYGEYLIRSVRTDLGISPETYQQDKPQVYGEPAVTKPEETELLVGKQ